MSVSTLIRELRRSSGKTQQELARRAGTSQAALARYESGAVSPSVNTLERIVRAGGGQLEMQLRRAPTDVDLSSDRAKQLRTSRKMIIDLAHAAGASNVRIFGSLARGESRPESDIDLLVDYDIKRGLLPIATLATELEKLLGAKVDVAPVQLLKPAVAQTALREAVPL